MPKFQKKPKQIGVVDWQEELNNPNSTYSQMVTGLAQAQAQKMEILKLLFIRASQVVQDEKEKEKEALQKPKQSAAEEEQKKAKEASNSQQLAQAQALEKQRQIDHEKHMQALAQQTTQALEKQLAEIEKIIETLSEKIAVLEEKIEVEEKEIAAVSDSIQERNDAVNKDVYDAAQQGKIDVYDTAGNRLSPAEAARRLENIHVNQLLPEERINHEQRQQWIEANPDVPEAEINNRFANDVFERETVETMAQYAAGVANSSGSATLEETSGSAFVNKVLLEALLTSMMGSKQEKLESYKKLAGLVNNNQINKEQFKLLTADLDQAKSNKTDLNKALGHPENKSTPKFTPHT